MGELLAHHYALSWSSRFFGPAPQEAGGAPSLDVCTAEEGWLLAGGVEPPRDGPSRTSLSLPPRAPAAAGSSTGAAPSPPA
ncbi:hypothetical protein O1L60_03330 [Streptomyces diastatochromogenes]|nr:hypothetical protein [Streptomyces diastatochromogenes]